MKKFRTFRQQVSKETQLSQAQLPPWSGQEDCHETVQNIQATGEQRHSVPSVVGFLKKCLSNSCLSS